MSEASDVQEVVSADGFDALLQEFVQLKKRKDGLELEQKQVSSRMSEIEPLLVEMLGARGMQSIYMHGLTLYLSVDRYVNKKGGVGEDQLCEVLNECGLGDMVKNSYSSASLKARVLEWMEQGIEIPESIANLINVGEVYRLKAMKR